MSNIFIFTEHPGDFYRGKEKKSLTSRTNIWYVTDLFAKRTESFLVLIKVSCWGEVS